MKKMYIIHGWAYSVEPWRATIEKLKDAGIEIVMLHVPGLTAESSAEWEIDGYMEWLDGKLKGQSGVTILGHSNGGRILMNYSIKFPGKLKHMILLNSAGIYDESKDNRRRILRILAKSFKPLKYIPGVRKIVYRLIGASDFDRAPKNMKVTLGNMIKSDHYLRPEQITAKVSLLWGSEDNYTPVSEGKKLHSLIKDSTLKVVDGWGHAPYKTHPEQLADEIISIVGDA